MKPILPAFLSCQSYRLSDAEKKLFSQHNPLGICLFKYGCENVKNREQLKLLIKEIKETIGRDDVLIAVDQEGGRVRRLTEPDFTPLAPQHSLTSPDLAKYHAYLTSADLKDCGINVNFAPVLDIEYENTSSALKGRCFGTDKQKTAELGQIMVDEYIKNAVCPCIKHLPGHGRSFSDPHLELPIIREKLDELENDFYPFKQIKNSPMGMVAHIVLETVDKNYPATVSKKIIKDIIREHIGFNGLLISDAIVMKSLKGSIMQRANDVISAGCDVICLGNADFEANVALCSTNLSLSDYAKEKLLNIKNIINKKTDFSDYAYVKNKYCTMLKNIITYEYEYDATEILSRMQDNGN